MQFVFIVCEVEGYQNILKLSYRLLAFTSYKVFLKKSKKSSGTSLYALFTAWFLTKDIYLKPMSFEINLTFLIEPPFLYDLKINKLNILRTKLFYLLSFARSSRFSHRPGSAFCLVQHVFTWGNSFFLFCVSFLISLLQ